MEPQGGVGHAERAAAAAAGNAGDVDFDDHVFWLDGPPPPSALQVMQIEGAREAAEERKKAGLGKVVKKAGDSPVGSASLGFHSTDDNSSDTASLKSTEGAAAPAPKVVARKRGRAHHDSTEVDPSAVALRRENKRLMMERGNLLQQISALEGVISEGLGDATLQDLRENELLRREIVLHKRFMGSFLQLINGAPSEQAGYKLVYEEACDSAHHLLLGLVADSQQRNWEKAKLPNELKASPARLEMHFKLADNLFDKNVPAAKVDISKKRLQLRVDLAHPGMSPEQVAQGYKVLLTDKAGKESLTEQSHSTELRKVHETEEGSMLLYHRKKYEEAKQRDRDVYLLFNSRVEKTTRSTIAMPRVACDAAASSKSGVRKAVLCQPRKRGRPLGSTSTTKPAWHFGNVEARFLTRVSTQILQGSEVHDDAERISDTVLHGAVIYQEDSLPCAADVVKTESDADSMLTRSVFFTSTPSNFHEEDDFEAWSSILKPDGTITDTFARYVGVIAQNFNSMTAPKM